jgi:hypothetical protein
MNANPEDPSVRRSPDGAPVHDDHLPQHVRDRMQTRERRSARGGGIGLTVLVLLLLVAAGGFVWWHSYQSANNIAARGAAATPTAATPDVTNRSFGVSVGHFPSEDAAIGERDRLTGMTHLPVSVGQASGEGGGLEFRVILGSYTSRAEAESAGRALESQSIIKDWRVVPLAQSM